MTFVAFAGARRTAALLQMLRMNPTGLPLSSLQMRLEDRVGGDMGSPETFDRWRRRAVADLGRYGETVVLEGGQNPRLRLETAVRSGARWLTLDPDLAALRQRLTKLLDLLDDSRELMDFPTLVKAHVPRDFIEFDYGGERVSGVAYQWRPTALLVKTDEGEFAYEVRGISNLRLKKRGTKGVNGPANPPLVPAPDWCVEAPPFASRSRGRAGNLRLVLEATRIVNLARARAAPSADDGMKRTISAEGLANTLGITAAELEENLDVVTELDPGVSLYDDQIVVDESVRTLEQRIDGADALLARQELSAATALGGIEQDYGIGLDLATVARYREVLDGFLDSADVDDTPVPSARQVIAATPSAPGAPADEIQVQLGDSKNWRRLRPDAVRLRSWRWFVLGELDGESIAEAGLPLSEIRCALSE